jgi:hypothetical protein
MMSYPVTTQRSAQRSLARTLYPFVSIPAFLAMSLLVMGVLILTIVALIFTSMLRFARWITDFLIFRSPRRSDHRQPAIIHS